MSAVQGQADFMWYCTRLALVLSPNKIIAARCRVYLIFSSDIGLTSLFRALAYAALAVLLLLTSTCHLWILQFGLAIFMSEKWSGQNDCEKGNIIIVKVLRFSQLYLSLCVWVWLLSSSHSSLCIIYNLLNILLLFVKRNKTRQQKNIFNNLMIAILWDVVLNTQHTHADEC